MDPDPKHWLPVRCIISGCCRFELGGGTSQTLGAHRTRRGILALTPGTPSTYQSIWTWIRIRMWVHLFTSDFADYRLAISQIIFAGWDSGSKHLSTPPLHTSSLTTFLHVTCYIFLFQLEHTHSHTCCFLRLYRKQLHRVWQMSLKSNEYFGGRGLQHPFPPNAISPRGSVMII